LAAETGGAGGAVESRATDIGRAGSVLDAGSSTVDRMANLRLIAQTNAAAIAVGQA
jgi:hypothetical protein